MPAKKEYKVIKPATDKQLTYIMKLLKAGYGDNIPVINWNDLNSLSASMIIKYLLSTKDYIQHEILSIEKIAGLIAIKTSY